MANAYRDLPSVSEILAATEALELPHSRTETVEAVRAELEALRSRIKSGEALDGAVTPQAIATSAAERLARLNQPHLRPVINATGIVLHTNLGRAPIAEAAARAAYEGARGYLNLEIDLESGERSSRALAIRSLLSRLTGAESATAVNNCAAATVLVLRALAAHREVIVSRGQLIEIGGSFRIPEIMGVSGAILREVGTTNITRIEDYELAITPATALLLRIHQSNYRICGFTATPTLDELVALGQERGLSVVDDIGSGALVDFDRFGLPGEPVARASVAAGADLVLFSGDKLLGGPQSGIIVGRKALIDRIQRDPLMRALRLDKMTLAALEATLRLYADEERALTAVPILRMLTIPINELRWRARNLADRLSAIAGIQCSTRDAEAFVGGGSLPDQALATAVVTVVAPEMGETELARRLRMGTTSVVARIQGGELLFDLRTIFPEQEDDLLNAVSAALRA
jgi:L-seryl-tRNA(Ser) seleniumtransferase